MLAGRMGDASIRKSPKASVKTAPASSLTSAEASVPTVVEEPTLRCRRCEDADRTNIVPLLFTALTQLTLKTDELQARVTSQPTITLRAFGRKLYSCHKKA